MNVNVRLTGDRTETNEFGFDQFELRDVGILNRFWGEGGKASASC